MKMTQDKCGLENCKDLTADLTGSCTIEVNMGDKQPMILHIDGKFSIDMFEKMGQLLQGQYKVVDNGNNFNVAYETLVTGVTGTTYEGKEAMTDSGPNKAVEKGYYIKCNEGSIDLYLLDGKGGKTKIATLNAGEDGTCKTKIATLNAGEDGTFTLNGQKVVKDTDAGNDATQPTDTGNETSADANSPDTSGNDAGQDNGQNPQTDASSTPPETSSTNPEPTFDAGQSGQETSQPEQPQATQPETTTSQPSSSPPKDGCSISTTSPTSPESQNSAFAQLGILLSAAALFLRKRKH
ncbi:LPXTG cell wall anchor domain-containing protein [Candidatus Peregrinibacteria bacterium]|nr:LPXTG cell wall anchor domain-containing protein [Candidatus Peregrinibacteria bacterium]